ncbi:ASCH domain-containing protein [Vibrio sp. SS-MA-C1-2]|uniref:ASCH domain-containing protein n=1 Tax=Vibrio sp. SS-MA-C1-2 TaxID=2908646 RepID=UPI001F267AEB|nr:ASCH domain-containing protein [Vibrio sp. SS-MA-C1-2]UJF17733.1 ASCH domain-containing protein [Vibrio sp. SS-MA-C1-2]
MQEQHKAYLEQYLQLLTTEQKNSVPQVIAEYFCADEYNANECARLINEGTKTASCSLKAGYDAENEPLPKVGGLTVVLDWQQNPVCIIELTEISLSPFNKVTAEFAAAEGEGDRSYQWWRDAHLTFFTHYTKSIDVPFTEDSLLVLERFKKVYPLSV